MEQHAKVIAVHPVKAANFIFLLLFQEDQAQYFAVPGR